MRVLAVTNIYPTAANAALGTFVEQQVKGLRGIGVDVEVLYVDRAHIGPGAYLSLPRRIQKRLMTFNADVVHAMYGGVMASLTTRAVRDRPTIVTFHGSDLLGEHLSGPMRRVLAAYGVRCSRTSAYRASGIVVVGPALCEALPGDINRSKVRVIPCGIDMERFRPMDRQACRAELGWADDGFCVLFNSNGDDPVKQPALAQAAVERLQRAGVPAGMRELRGLPNTEVPKVLNAADVLLLTSRHEGSPTIVKEALACNVPVVSVDVGDVRQRLDGIDGCYLAEPEAGDLAAKLQLVYEGRRRVEGRARLDELSIANVALQLRGFYADVCGRKTIALRPLAKTY